MAKRNPPRPIHLESDAVPKVLSSLDRSSLVMGKGRQARHSQKRISVFLRAIPSKDLWGTLFLLLLLPLSASQLDQCSQDRWGNNKCRTFLYVGVFKEIWRGKGRTALTTVKKQNDDNISAPKILRWTKWTWICPNSAKPALNISKFFSLLGFFNSRKCFYSLLFNFCPGRTLNTRGVFKRILLI